MGAYLQEGPIDMMALRRDLPRVPACGGYACFEGIVRDHNHGREVLRLEYECYRPLAQKELERILDEARSRFGLGHAQVVHRTGALEIGDTAVLVQVLAAHRAEAFEGCRYIIDELKKRVPIWKKEIYADGTDEWTRCAHAGAAHG